MKYPSNETRKVSKPQASNDPWALAFLAPAVKNPMANPATIFKRLKPPPAVFGRAVYSPAMRSGLVLVPRLAMRFVPYLGAAMMAYELYHYFNSKRTPPRPGDPYPGFDKSWRDMRTYWAAQPPTGPTAVIPFKPHWDLLATVGDPRPVGPVSVVGLSSFSEVYYNHWPYDAGTWGWLSANSGYYRKSGPPDDRLVGDDIITMEAQTAVSLSTQDVPLPMWFDPMASQVFGPPTTVAPPWEMIPNLPEHLLPEGRVRGYTIPTTILDAIENTGTPNEVTETVVETNGNTLQPPDVTIRPELRRPPREKEKEKKVTPKSSRASQLIAGAMGTFTESADLVNVMWLALPKSARSGYFKLHTASGEVYYKKRFHPPFHTMIADIYRGFGKLDIDEAISGFVENQIEDALYGKLGQTTKNASKGIGNLTGLSRASQISGKNEKEYRARERKRKQTAQYLKWRKYKDAKARRKAWLNQK